MNLFFTYILAAMVYWVPITQHCYWPISQKCINESNLLYQEIAKDIVEVISEPDIKLPFEGTDYKVKSALLMASIAATESGFNQDVDSCKTVGDHGIAFGLWQTHSSRAVSCNNRKSALRKAIEIVNQSFEYCKKYPLLDRMAGYTTGSCHTNWGPSRLKMNKALNYYAANPFADIVEEDSVVAQGE